MKRPDGLNRARAERCTSQREDCECCECTSFNAGADAYEAAIWKMAKESPTGIFTFDTNTINVFEEVE